MSGNLTPWLVLAAVVAVSLYLKGYIRLPIPKPTAQADQSDRVAIQTPGQASIDDLAKLGSRVLGIAFAKAVRAEAEHEIAGRIAFDAAKTINARFTDPFSEPGPAGAVNQQPADPSGH